MERREEKGREEKRAEECRRGETETGVMEGEEGWRGGKERREE